MNNKEIINYLAQKHFKLSADNIIFLGSGSFGNVYKANTSGMSAVFKIYKTQDIAVKEFKSLSALAQNGKIKIPKVYFIDSCSGADVICMEYIDGKNALFNLKLLMAPKSVRDKFSNDVIDSAIAIHSITNNKFGYVDNPVYDSWNAFYKPYALDIYNQAETANKKGKFDSFILEVMKKVIIRYDFIFDEDVREASLVHGDLNLMNVMVNKKCELAAFIDPLNSFYGDKEFELFQLANFTGKYFNLPRLYKERCRTSEKVDLKSAFYSLWNEASVYLNTGRYSSFFMINAVKGMKKELKKL